MRGTPWQWTPHGPMLKDNQAETNLEDSEEVPIGSPLADRFGFTADRFDGWMWRVDKDIYISFVVSKKPGCGNLSRLFDAIWANGYRVKVPTPLGTMPDILRHKGFVMTTENTELGPCEVWLK